jgi:predicted transglutaminase-like cysteine proteinase
VADTLQGEEMAEQAPLPSGPPATGPQLAVPANAPQLSPPIQEKKKRNLILWIAVILVIALVMSNAIWALGMARNDEKLDSLGSELADLQQNQTSLQALYDSLQTDHASLQQQIQVYETFRLESTVADYYETLRDDHSMQTSDWWYSWLSTQDKVDFCADLAKHDIGLVYWELTETAYHDYDGTYSYNDAKAKLTYFLSVAGVSSSDSSVAKVEKILEAVVSYIAYRPDMNDRYNSPWETLAFRSGDCDDFSTLVAALFQLAGIDSAMEFVRNSANDGHAMVLVKLDDLESYGYYYYSDLTSYGLGPGQWIVIEPQSTIDQQDVSSWMSQWNIIAAAEV